MSTDREVSTHGSWPVLSDMPIPAKALTTMIIMTLAIGMLGALGQIVVHDIIPTFFSENAKGTMQAHNPGAADNQHKGPAAPGELESAQRGDLFSETPLPEKPVGISHFYGSEQFVWTLKWTHIHLFGMGMIFIFTGLVTLFLSLSGKAKTLLVVLPFIGVWIDILSVWLKGYLSPAFFWLHLPGRLVFGAIFAFVSLRAMWEMWWPSSTGCPVI